MFFEVSSLTYHSPITIELLTYRVLLGTPWYSSRGMSLAFVDGHRSASAVEAFRVDPRSGPTPGEDDKQVDERGN